MLFFLDKSKRGLGWHRRLRTDRRKTGQAHRPAKRHCRPAVRSTGFPKIKCSDFLAAPKDEVSSILIWLEGFYARHKAPPIIYQDKTIKDFKALAQYWTANDNVDLIKAAEAVMLIETRRKRPL
jgi:hypothetical protein